jgi:ABC-2 type transport system permease protein
MTAAAVSAELFKLRTTRGPWVLAATSIALFAAVLAFNAALLGRPGQPPLVPGVLGDLARVPGALTAAAALLLGLLCTTGEYRHHTVLTTRLGQPRVARGLLAKAAAAALAGAALALVTAAMMVSGAAAVLAARDVAVEPWRHGVPAAVAGAALVAALYAVAGVGLGELLRSPALAVGAAAGWAFVVEGVLPVVLRAPGLGHWLPTGAARSALSVGSSAADGLLVPWLGLLLLTAYATGLLLAGYGRAARTDP